MMILILPLTLKSATLLEEMNPLLAGVVIIGESEVETGIQIENYPGSIRTSELAQKCFRSNVSVVIFFHGKVSQEWTLRKILIPSNVSVGIFQKNIFIL
jgi:hypothetical protein